MKTTRMAVMLLVEFLFQPTKEQAGEYLRKFYPQIKEEQINKAYYCAYNK